MSIGSLTTDVVNENAIRDDAFMAFKERLQGDENIPIEWEQAFQLDYGSFMGSGEIVEKEEIIAALEVLEAKPYGQALFRDIITNDARIEPVTISVYLGVGQIPYGVFYSPGADSVIYNYDFMRAMQNNPVYLAEIERLGLDQHEVVLLHEGDHAARMYGDDTLPNPMAANGEMIPELILPRMIAAGCFEEYAMERANQYRAEHGLLARESYVDIGAQIDIFIDRVQANGLTEGDARTLSGMSEKLEIFEALILDVLTLMSKTSNGWQMIGWMKF